MQLGTAGFVGSINNSNVYILSCNYSGYI